jgi:hypothetical protein
MVRCGTHGARGDAHALLARNAAARPLRVAGVLEHHLLRRRLSLLLRCRFVVERALWIVRLVEQRAEVCAESLPGRQMDLTLGSCHRRGERNARQGRHGLRKLAARGASCQLSVRAFLSVERSMPISHRVQVHELGEAGGALAVAGRLPRHLDQQRHPRGGIKICLLVPLDDPAVSPLGRDDQHTRHIGQSQSRRPGE